MPVVAHASARDVEASGFQPLEEGGDVGSMHLAQDIVSLVGIHHDEVDVGKGCTTWRLEAALLRLSALRRGGKGSPSQGEEQSCSG